MPPLASRPILVSMEQISFQDRIGKQKKHVTHIGREIHQDSYLHVLPHMACMVITSGRFVNCFSNVHAIIEKEKFI